MGTKDEGGAKLSMLSTRQIIRKLQKKGFTEHQIKSYLRGRDQVIQRGRKSNG